MEIILHSNHVKGELAHRTVKAWYSRTNRKTYIYQITRIERRQARLRRIRRNLNRNYSEVVEKTSQPHHHIGISQKLYVHVGTFLRENSGDPAIKVNHAFP